ncbi:MAG TPA: hypothetical protein DCM05_15370 [Elusimicrobia bacterium]|nr:hypothetical protein [Elusimicrobiota bacterium]
MTARETAFVREVSHALRSPLATVESCLQVVLDGYAPAPEKQREMLERAQRKATALLRMVKDLQDLSGMENRGRSRRKSALDLGAAVGKTLESFRAKAAEIGVTLESDVQEGMPPIRMDAYDLETLLARIVDNAVKYSRPGGLVRIGASFSRGEHQIVVADTGIGIEPEALKKVFEEFFRSEGARAFTDEGAGLGLSIVRRIVDDCGGGIDVESQLGEGSLFRVHLPEQVQGGCHA